MANILCFKADGDGADEGCASVSALVEELGVHRNVLYRQRRLRDAAQGSSAKATTSPVRKLRQQVRELERALAEKMLEVDFF